MYPLPTNDRNLSPAQVLEAHKGQPTIEKRFEQVKTVHEIAPVFLKNEGRIEALFTLHFFGLLAQALIERELRGAMQRAGVAELPRRSCWRCSPRADGSGRCARTRGRSPWSARSTPHCRSACSHGRV